ncbi:hypothetical protein VP01_71g3 [Puccinia sorghi]|uniref:Uncharacterized protein n=1 Tax=Puccinia sorghi TaxID=27349 RepID=A0A0L6UFG1_9BASI|nr:hypothetical protein VP01_71g3 [Puccinia sorghi]
MIQPEGFNDDGIVPWTMRSDASDSHYRRKINSSPADKLAGWELNRYGENVIGSTPLDIGKRDDADIRQGRAATSAFMEEDSCLDAIRLACLLAILGGANSRPQNVAQAGAQEDSLSLAQHASNTAGTSPDSTPPVKEPEPGKTNADTPAAPKEAEEGKEGGAPEAHTDGPPTPAVNRVEAADGGPPPPQGQPIPSGKNDGPPPPAGKDASAPGKHPGPPGKEAGPPANDAGPPRKETGPPGKNAGPPGKEAGPPGKVAGPPGEEAAPPLKEAGPPGKEAGPPLKEAGPPGRDTKPPPGRDGGPAGKNGPADNRPPPPGGEDPAHQKHPGSDKPGPPPTGAAPPKTGDKKHDGARDGDSKSSATKPFQLSGSELTSGLAPILVAIIALIA